MINPAELYLRARHMGVSMDADGTHLRVWPKSKLTPELVEELRRLKPALLAWLASPTRTAGPPIIEDARPEARHLAGWAQDGRPIYIGTAAEWQSRFREWEPMKRGGRP